MSSQRTTVERDRSRADAALKREAGVSHEGPSVGAFGDTAQRPAEWIPGCSSDSAWKSLDAMVVSVFEGECRPRVFARVVSGNGALTSCVSCYHITGIWPKDVKEEVERDVGYKGLTAELMEEFRILDEEWSRQVAAEKKVRLEIVS